MRLARSRSRSDAAVRRSRHAVQRMLLGIGFGLAVCIGCVPLTFSRQEAIDFSTYRRAWVDVSLTAGAGYYGDVSASVYLASELRNGSGFESVTTDASEEVDVLLRVELALVEVVTYYDDGPDFSYESSARYGAFDRQGRRIDGGEVRDSSEFPSEAIEDALDEVALHYLRPYRY